MLLSQAGIEGGRDGRARRIQALTEQGEALGETQGWPSLQIKGGMREKGDGGGGCGGTAEMGEGLVLELQGLPSVLSQQVTVWEPVTLAERSIHMEAQPGKVSPQSLFLHVIPPKTPSG